MIYDDEPIGLCTVFVSERLVDGPSLRQALAPTQLFATSLGSVCASWAGPIDLDSWGDTEATLACHADLGFSPVEQVAGWELKLKRIERTRRAWADDPADRRLVLSRHSGTLAQARRLLVWIRETNEDRTSTGTCDLVLPGEQRLLGRWNSLASSASGQDVPNDEGHYDHCGGNRDDGDVGCCEDHPLHRTTAVAREIEKPLGC